jgi:hypothetical protein
VSKKASDSKSKRINLTIPLWLWEGIISEFKGSLGEKDSELVKNILLAYLTEYRKYKNGK